MKTIIVPSRKRDQKSFAVAKYETESMGIDALAILGVWPDKILRRTTPDATKLTPLAAWLVERAPTSVYGRMPRFRHEGRVRCYNGKTEAQTLRERCPGERTENIIRCYDLETKLAQIDDWLFSVIEPNQTDEEYWNQEAVRMIEVGVVRVEIGGNVFEVQG